MIEARPRVSDGSARHLDGGRLSEKTGLVVVKDHFNVTPPIGWQIDPFGHSAVQAYLLGAEFGFDFVFFGRIDYQDRAKRKGDKRLEVVWRGSKSLGSSSQIFAGAFPENYEPPPSGFYFEVNDDSPIVQDDIDLFDYNVEERVNDFANITRTNHVMWTMVTDFKYQYAESWFQNMDSRVNALYSTPSIYTDAKHVEPDSWPLKEDNYFPYASDVDAYWTAYFTSRAGLKGYVRMLCGHYLAARQLEVMTGRNKTGPTIDSLGDALGIAQQHHDAVSGTSQQYVANDYAKWLSIGQKVVQINSIFIANNILSSTMQGISQTGATYDLRAVGIVGTWTVVRFGMQNGNRYLFVNIFFADKITDFSYHLITFFKSLHHGGVDMIRSGRDKIETLQQVIYLFYKFLP
ncbi:putative alpha-mannosidase [Helianthus anomalus]